MVFRHQLRTHTPFIRSTTHKLLVFTTWIPALIFFNDHIGEHAFIEGPSMYPYINADHNRSLSQDICWVSKLPPSFFLWPFTKNNQNNQNSKDDSQAGLKRGMIVSFRSPNHPEVYAIKRVIALPGDTVVTRKPYPVERAVVPDGHMWVEGDNGRMSLDSNTYGPVPVNLVEGRLTWVVWPWRSWGRIRWWEWRCKTVVVKGPDD